jgi:predicted nucleic acid-binding protein
MVIVDSTVWIDYLRGAKTPQSEWLESAINNQRIGLTDLIFCEVLQGISNEKQFDEVRRCC